ncbi:PTS transporter subunit EIIC [Enterococcus gallinarum]|nr:PTS transporter subunit EIIC [Enterococcus gallinarum]
MFWVIRHIIGFDINGFLSNLLMPLKDVLAGNSLFGGLLTVFLICFFWVLGIHGPAIMGPVIRPFWDISIAENMEVFNQPAMRMNYQTSLQNNFCNGLFGLVGQERRLRWLSCFYSQNQTI